MHCVTNIKKGDCTKYDLTFDVQHKLLWNRHDDLTNCVIALSWKIYLKKTFDDFADFLATYRTVWTLWHALCAQEVIFVPAKVNKISKIENSWFLVNSCGFHNSFGNSSNRKHLQKKSISLWKKGVCSYWCHHSTLSYHPRTLWPLIMIESVNLCNMWPKHGFGNQAT